VQFRAEFFNLMNHTNFAVPMTGSLQVFNGSVLDTAPFSEAPSANAGLITSTVTNSRQIQFAVKLIF